MRIDELLSQGQESLVWGLQHDDILEGLLRHLAASQEFLKTKDIGASSHMLGFQAPDSIMAQG